MASQGADAPTATSEQPQQLMEMNTLSSSSTQQQPSAHPVDEVELNPSMAQPSSTAELTSSTPVEPSQSHSQPQPQPASHPRLVRHETEALGPATETSIVPRISASTPTGPALSISLMLTTGARHPYQITEKYLSNRKTEAKSSADGSFDPRELTGYKLKELIWTDWRSEWDPRPAAPSSIRLIILGKMVDDKKTLKDYNFHLDSTNIVHMTVKPADFTEDEEVKGAGKGGSLRARDGEERGAGCRCVIL